MKIVNHRLVNDDNTPIPYRQSPNIGGKITNLKYLVMHYTAGPGADHAVNWLANPTAKASAHLVISRSGQITQLVPFDTVAWHAGKSEWKGLNGMNNFSIGIELDNAGVLTKIGTTWQAWFGTKVPNEQVLEAIHKNESVMRGWQMYTPEQLFVALEVASLLVQTYKLEDIIGHDDIAPGRKSDPGPAFPMDSFRSRLYGRADDGVDDGIYEATSNLNVRTGAGAQFDLHPASSLPRGTRLKATGQESGDWMEIDVMGEVKGYKDIHGWVNRGFVVHVD